MNNFQRIIQFLVDFRHQLYIYLGLFLIAVAVSRLSIFEFLQGLNSDHNSAVIYLGTILMFGSINKNLRDFGVWIVLLCLILLYFKLI